MEGNGVAMLDERIAKRLKRNRFVVLGRAGMDLYADPPGEAVERAERFVAALGGSAGNIAAGLARLGAGVDLLGAVSDDAIGRFVMAQLADYGIGAKHVSVVRDGRRTSLAVTESRVEGLQGVLYRNHAADFALSVAEAEAVDFQGVGALIVTGTALAASPSRDAVFAALERARMAGTVCVLDVDWRAYSWQSEAEARAVCGEAVALCDLTVGNDEEFGLLAGEVERGRDFAAGLPWAVYKMGAAGSETFCGGASFRCGIFAVKALKPLGSGDGFMAGMLAALARGEGVEVAVRQGSAVAALVVSGVGCAPAMPMLGSLLNFIKELEDAHRAP
ncbi:PfkB family carbohydrate kinase [Paragemmobacter aquarius]|nr:PfkB family carbohydrate kinase [Gemmobacter aquarius]